MFVYVGTYTGEKSQGIYRTRLDLATGTLSAPELAATATNPSFLALDPGQDAPLRGQRGGHVRWPSDRLGQRIRPRPVVGRSDAR